MTIMDDLETTVPSNYEAPLVIDDLDNELPSDQVDAAPVAQPVVEAPVAQASFDRKAQIPGLIEASELSVEGVALATKEALSKEPKVTMMIPLDPGETSPATRSVIINGYPFHIKKNTMVELPISVVNLLKNSYRMVDETLNGSPLNLEKADAKKRAALGLA